MSAPPDFLREEVRCGYTVSSEMKECWAISLDLLEAFMDFCKRHSLKWFAVYGTLLGAARHGGFIPWDDDIDVAMLRADFERLRGLADQFSPPYFLQTPEREETALAGTFLLRNSDTAHITWHDRFGSHNRGCCIDILPVDAVFSGADGKRQSNQIRHWRRLIVAKARWSDCYPEFIPNGFRRATAMAAGFSREELLQKHLAACTACPLELAAGFGISGSERPCLLPLEAYDNLLYLPFEHLEIPVPSGYQEFLRAAYGTLELPEPEKRVPPHCGITDTRRSYREYRLERYNDIFASLDGERIYLFGAGQVFGTYMKHHGRRYPPAAVFDNDPGKWGTVIQGIPIKNPAELPTVLADGSRLIIATFYENEISAQLDAMGIDQYFIYTEGKRYGETI